jgi:hypothetical protein
MTQGLGTTPYTRRFDSRCALSRFLPLIRVILADTYAQLMARALRLSAHAQSDELAGREDRGELHIPRYKRYVWHVAKKYGRAVTLMCIHMRCGTVTRLFGTSISHRCSCYCGRRGSRRRSSICSSTMQTCGNCMISITREFKFSFLFE